MNISTRVLKTLSGRRKQSIDPAKHFAVRIRDGYAVPVTREQFLSAVHRVGGTASLLKKIAAAGLRQASEPAARCDRHLVQAMGSRLAEAERMQSDFDIFVRQLIFSDQNAFRVVEPARKAIAEAIVAFRTALAAINRTTKGDQVPHRR